MPRPEPSLDSVTRSQEIMIFTGEDLALDNFMVLYGCEILTAYRDGRIKVRTPAGRFTDLHRTRSVMLDKWLFSARSWAEQIQEVDAAHGSPFQRRRSHVGLIPVPRGTK